MLKYLGLTSGGSARGKVFLLATVIATLPAFAQPVLAEIVLHGRCHMDECWDQKFLGKTLLKSSSDGRLYSVKLAPRSWPMNSSPPSRFGPAETGYVYCSATKPAFIFRADGIYYAHLLNPGGDWYGYNVSDHRVYWTTCHNFVGPDFFSEEMRSRAIQLGYPLNLPSEQIELNNVLEIMD